MQAELYAESGPCTGEQQPFLFIDLARFSRSSGGCPHPVGGKLLVSLICRVLKALISGVNHGH